MKHKGNSTDSSSDSISHSIKNSIPTISYPISDCNDHGDRSSESSQERSKKRPRYDPFQMRDKSNGTTTGGALLHLIKSSFGTGVLAMPNAFKNGGLIFGLVGTMAIGTICTHCIYLLVLCSQTLARRTRRPALGFADTAAMAFKTGPNRFRAWASFAREFVNAALFCTYYFGNCVYIILISASFKQVADSHTHPEWHFSIRTWILGLAFPLLPLGIIRTLRLLVPFSAVATTFILVGLGSTMAWVVVGVSPFTENGIVTTTVPLPSIWSRPWIAPVTHIPLFFAMVLFAIEGVGAVLPIENSMSHPEHFLRGRPCGVLYIAMTLVVFFYGTAGFLGYLRFGEKTEGSITLNLPNDIFSETVKIMVTLSIIFSYGLQFCIPSEIAWSKLEPWLRERKWKINYAKSDNDASKAVGNISNSNASMTTVITATITMTIDQQKQFEIELERERHPMDGIYYIMRASMILGTFLIAAIVPNLSPIISLFGAVFFSILGLLCPAIIHLVTFWEHDDEDDEDLKYSNSHTNWGFDEDENESCEKTGSESLQQDPSSSVQSASKRKGMSLWTIAKDIAIVLIALIALVSGTYVSVTDIIATYGDHDGNANNNRTVNA